MSIVGLQAPDFEGEAALHGEIVEQRLADHAGRWLYLVFYPLDFTFVCPTELVALSEAAPRFHELGCDIVGISVDSVHTHLAWTRTPRSEAGVDELDFPLLSDLGGAIAERYGVLRGSVALRGAFLVDPQGIVQHATINNLSVGRNVDEMLRVLQAFQFTVEHGEVCPMNWRPGDAGMSPTLDGVKATIG